MKSTPDAGRSVFPYICLVCMLVNVVGKRVGHVSEWATQPVFLHFYVY